MLLIDRFVFLDTRGGLPLFLIKYILIGGMFAVTGYGILTLLKGRKQ